MPPPPAPEALQFDPVRGTINAALAVRKPFAGGAAAFPAASLNVLPAPYRPKPISLPRVIGIPGGIAAAVLIIPMVIMMQGTAANIDSMQKQLNTVNQLMSQRTAQRQSLNKEITALQKDLESARITLEDLALAREHLETGQEVINGDLRLILDIVPPTVILTSISESQTSLTIAGNSWLEADILKYARDLDLSGRFTETYITSITVKKFEGGAELLTFNLMMKGKE